MQFQDFYFFAKPLRPTNLKISVLALASQVLFWGHIFWQIVGLIHCDWSFLITRLFSLVNYVVTVGHFVFPQNIIFSALAALSTGPILGRIPKKVSKHMYGIHLKSQSVISSFNPSIFLSKWCIPERVLYYATLPLSPWHLGVLNVWMWHKEKYEMMIRLSYIESNIFWIPLTLLLLKV